MMDHWDLHEFFSSTQLQEIRVHQLSLTWTLQVEAKAYLIH